MLTEACLLHYHNDQPVRLLWTIDRPLIPPPATLPPPTAGHALRLFVSSRGASHLYPASPYRTHTPQTAIRNWHKNVDSRSACVATCEFIHAILVCWNYCSWPVCVCSFARAAEFNCVLWKCEWRRVAPTNTNTWGTHRKDPLTPHLHNRELCTVCIACKRVVAIGDSA